MPGNERFYSQFGWFGLKRTLGQGRIKLGQSRRLGMKCEAGPARIVDRAKNGDRPLCPLAAGFAGLRWECGCLGQRGQSPFFAIRGGLSFTAGKARLWIGRKMGTDRSVRRRRGLRVCAGNVAPGTERSVPIFRDSRRPQLYRGEGEIVDRAKNGGLAGWRWACGAWDRRGQSPFFAIRRGLSVTATKARKLMARPARASVAKW